MFDPLAGPLAHAGPPGGVLQQFVDRGRQVAGEFLRLARLNVDGTLDSEFLSGANGSVMEIAVQPDGGFLIGGLFTSAWGRGIGATGRSYLARFAPDGTLDTAFNPGLNSQVDALAFQADGKLVVGGYFTRAQRPGSSAAIVRNHLARLNLDG